MLAADRIPLEPKTYRTAGDESVEAGRAPGQMGWYRLAAKFSRGRSVLDVGCGMGAGLRLLQQTAKMAKGQDLDERLASDDVIVQQISQFADKSYDVVVCVDVIEHVEEDRAFLADLCRVAREGVFISTPLSYHGREIWPYHVREYRAAEFIDLVQRQGHCSFYIGSPSGSESHAVKARWWWLALNRLINHPLTNKITRALQKLLPRHLRNHAHQAVFIQVGDAGRGNRRSERRR